MFEYIPNNTLSRAELNYESGEILNVHYGDVLIKFGPVLDPETDILPFITELKKGKYTHSLLRNGDVIIADTAEDETVGKATEITNVGLNKVVSGLHTIACRPRIKMAPMYLGYYINSESYHKQLFSLMQGVKVLSVSKSNIGKTTIAYPYKDEQQKICGLLNLIEKKIEIQRQFIEHLKKYKRGVSDCIFNEINANKDNCQILFSDIFCLLQNNTFSRDMLTQEKTDVLNIHYGDILVKFGSVLDVDTTSVPYIKDDIELTKYSENSYLKNGDIIFADTAEDYTVGKITEVINAREVKILSGLHTIPCRPMINFAPMYLGYYLNSSVYREQILPLIQGTKVSSINKSELQKTHLAVPIIEEQKKIAKLLYALDRRIIKMEKELDKLIQAKNGLLQQLFI